MPVPRVWGTGLAADDERATSPHRWRGLSLPGFALMEVRHQFASGKLCEHAARCLGGRTPRSGAGKPIRHKPVEAHVLFGSFADKATVDLCRDPHHEPA